MLHFATHDSPLEYLLHIIKQLYQLWHTRSAYPWKLKKRCQINSFARIVVIVVVVVIIISDDNDDDDDDDDDSDYMYDADDIIHRVDDGNDVEDKDEGGFKCKEWHVCALKSIMNISCMSESVVDISDIFMHWPLKNGKA